MTLKSQIDRFSQNEEKFNALITGSAGTTVDLGEAGVVKSVATVISEMAAGVDRGSWATTTAYVINDIVLEGGAYYRCRENHTSGTFATDLAAGKWRLNQGGDSTILTHRGRTLDDVITARFDNVTQMIADVNLVVGDVVETFANQNGTAVNQKWEIVAAATGTDDGGSYIDLTGSGLQAEQIFNSTEITASRFGCCNDGSDGQRVLTGIAYARSVRKPFVLDIDINTSDSDIALTLTQGDPIVIIGPASGLIDITSTRANPFYITSADPATRGWFEQVYLQGFRVLGDGITSDVGVKVYGASYANTKIEDVKVRGFKTTHLEIEQCWDVTLNNLDIGRGSESRTTSGTIGVNVINANAVHLTNSAISSIGLNYDGLGFKATSTESVSIDRSTIENMQTYIEIQSGSGPVSIGDGGTNYFENSSTVQGLIDITESPIKLGTVSTLRNVSVRNNWFLYGNNAINVDFQDVDKAVFENNSHNPLLANDGYYKCGANSRNIKVGRNSRINAAVPGISGMTDTDVTNTINATTLNNESIFVQSDSFNIVSGTPTATTNNDSNCYRFNDTTDAEIATMCILPPSWGICKVKTYALVSYSAASANSVVFFAIPTVIQNDGTLISPSVVSKVKTVGASYTPDVPVTDTHSLNWIVTRTDATEPVKLRFKRSGTNASDTFTGTMDFYGMIVERLDA